MDLALAGTHDRFLFWSKHRMTEQHEAEKRQVHDFWNQASCGENLYLAGTDRAAYEAQAEARYRLEPYIREFAKFENARGLRVLEIGVGLGADHRCFAEAGAALRVS
jgi:hypothetical protein